MSSSFLQSEDHDGYTSQGQGNTGNQLRCSGGWDRRGSSVVTSSAAGGSRGRQIRGSRVGLVGGGHEGIVLELKIGAGDASLVGKMNHNRAVSKEGTESLLGRGEVVSVLCRVRRRLDAAVLAAQITDLA